MGRRMMLGSRQNGDGRPSFDRAPMRFLPKIATIASCLPSRYIRCRTGAELLRMLRPAWRRTSGAARPCAGTPYAAENRDLSRPADIDARPAVCVGQRSPALRCGIVGLEPCAEGGSCVRTIFLAKGRYRPAAPKLA